MSADEELVEVPDPIDEPAVPEDKAPPGFQIIQDLGDVLLPSMTPSWENEDSPWRPMPRESMIWYRRFERYYLMQGLNRSIMAAERLYRKEVGLKVEMKHQASNTWTMAAKRYRWRERAVAWDQELTRRASEEVTKSMIALRAATPKAVATLILKLTDPKLAVAAAKEILDRGGVPAVTKQVLTHKLDVTSDEMAEATKEAHEWETKMLDGNG